MKAIHRIATTAALVAAVMSVPAPALAAEPVPIETLTSAAATASADHERATTRMQALDARLVEARAELAAVEAILPSSPSEEFEAVGVAMGGLFSRSMAQRAEVIVDGLDERKTLEAEIAKLVSERATLVEDVAETRETADAATAELQTAQQAAAAAAAAEAERVRATIAPNVRLMIDPGHGGKDPGATNGAGINEKDTNLQISSMIVEAAKRQGWQVGITRSGDWFVPLMDRPNGANAWGATAFVSIHSNAGSPSPMGNMTIHRSPEGAALGQQIMEELDPLTPYGDIGNRADVRGLAVLRGAHVPAALVEIMSLSSPEEVVQLVNPQVQAQYAEAVVKGVADFHGIAYVPPAQPAPAAEVAPAPEAAVGTETPASADASATPELDVPASQEPGWLGNLLNLLVR